MELSPVVLPFACLPNVEYMSWMIHSAGLNIEVHETFPRQTCRNRYAILTAEGPFMLTIPVKRPGGNHTPFKEVLLDDPAKWVNNHWRQLNLHTTNHPFFSITGMFLRRYSVSRLTPCLSLTFNF
ncbi:MAG: WbqC family protein [Lentimicrobium sp.]|jgi:hypothetical protein|nr:WbqC family protein [Lentimicrobium sp.]